MRIIKEKYISHFNLGEIDAEEKKMLSLVVDEATNEKVSNFLF